jgi:hypothetical protein
MKEIKTLAELKKSGYISRSIKDELRDNLREKLKSGQPVFEGVHGFENTVIPHLMLHGELLIPQVIPGLFYGLARIISPYFFIFS